MDNLYKAAGALMPSCVAEGFETEGRIVKLFPLGEGHINRTYKVTCALPEGGTVVLTLGRPEGDDADRAAFLSLKTMFAKMEVQS